jgi:predicted acylesterase/phospholipase RssA
VAHAAENASTPQRREWALVLSGGVARGFAHGGIVQALEEQGARPDLVVGCSMGALIGAMYASGFSADSMRSILRDMPWQALFGSGEGYRWRTTWPRSWIELVSGGSGTLSIPAAYFDNTYLNHVLVELFLSADARAQGDFDRLRIPFRAVGTDLRTRQWVMLDHGSLARACRISSGIPFVFPPVAEGSALLVDGGLSSNLPISAARAAGAQRVLAVDVALPYPSFLDLLDKLAPGDTISAAAGDTLVWLKIPRAGAADFAGAEMIMAAGYEEGGAAVRSWVRRSGLDRTMEPLVPPTSTLPPLSSQIEFHGRGTVRRPLAARRALGPLPTGPFQPDELRPALRRLSQSGQFESAWPVFRTQGDSTVLGFDVREHPILSLGTALALNNDDGWRVHLGLTYRPTESILPSVVKAGIAWRDLGWMVHGRIEPQPLDYGGTGWILTGSYQELDTRIFIDGNETARSGTNRGEALLGLQVPLGRQYEMITGAGYGRTRHSADWDGVLLALRAQGKGMEERFVDAEVGTGDNGYARVVAHLEYGVRRWGLKLTPSVHAAAVDGTPAADALVGLGGPHSLSGFRHDEWLGERAYAGSLELAYEPSRQLRIYTEGQIGRVEDALSDADLGDEAVVGFGIGAEANLPIGPLRLEYGFNSAHHDRFDVVLGTRF